MILRLFVAMALMVCASSVTGQTLQDVLQDHQGAVEKASRKTIDPVIEDLIASGLPSVPGFLEEWREKNVWVRKSDGLFFYADTVDKATYTLRDLTTGADVGTVEKSDIKQLRPNSGVRSVIATALVRFQLSDPDPFRRIDALTSIERDPEPEHLEPLRASIADETAPALRARKERLERLLSVSFEQDEDRRIIAIRSFDGDLGVDARAALNPILRTKLVYAEDVPDDANIAAQVIPGSEDLSVEAAYALMVGAGAAAAIPDADARKAILIKNIQDGQVAGFDLVDLDTQDARDQAYVALAQTTDIPVWSPTLAKSDIVKEEPFALVYGEPSEAVTDAALKILNGIETRVAANQFLDLGLDAISLASIYFLAAIGLAITFGVMGVINMAHGEFIMMGAYTGYVVQLFVPDYTLSLILAVPLAFAVTFAAGVAMERLVIRWLYNRPLETLLATFGISIALQQLAKNIFGTQARPLTAPGWLDGAWMINDVVSISYIRIAIFGLSLLFLGILLYILKRTRLGLEVRAVTQNPKMAAAVGINPDRINMLTFGLGSGIAGIAGVAIGLYAKVTSELGTDYIVQSFMTVVVGGVGNIWGTLLGATMIGSLQKGIEWFNPSNTLAAQTYMILFIILFIQIRPRGIIALKGRAAGD
ncbi:urea ABC transporter permease subunit UrtB [Litoreibacter roseus]|uniref:Branched-chain amino acid ABC transporter permease n=1 Tax=Litoreibacter roseus TaxID=2601869 RepID=A0A6N6JCQ5_9RHOB|nr:urea ABC transporter permease subunit UrtB [Litoreibacter roseus]GFE63209.1 branched-chain amino acid ABC transporter permease [Litoreibacter roseus]